MPAFKHPSLPSTRSTRLILLWPSLSRRTSVRCQLINATLSSPPRYEAVSYTWEGQCPSRLIQCNDSALLVTPNVESALKQLRRRFVKRWLWIDAICIDQRNPDERAQQVPLMGLIYRKADRVVVWLGEGDQATRRGIKALKWVFPLYKLALHFSFTRGFALRAFSKAKAHFQEALLHDGHGTDRQPNPSLTLRGLRQIVFHNWFRRIWTIQEIGLASNAIVQYGSSIIKWPAFSAALGFDGIVLRPRISPPLFAEGGYNPSVPLYTGVPFMIRTQQIQLLHAWLRESKGKESFATDGTKGAKGRFPPLPFILNLLLTGLNPEYMTTDPKDRIMGLFGILRTLGVELPDPDYRKTLSELVLEAFTAVSAKHQSLELLHFVTGEHSLGGLPSWVPDFWTVPWCPSDGEPTHSVNKKWQTLGPDFQIQGARLQLWAIQVDTVGSVTGTVDATNVDPKGRGGLELSSELFVAGLKEWLRFAQTGRRTHALSDQNSVPLLSKLLLHSQVFRFYQDASSISHLLAHLANYIHKVETSAPLLISGNDRLFDQVQSLISDELLADVAKLTAVSPAHYLPKHMYDPALVIQRWVREYTARKRLFTTVKGHVGIGWRALREGDQIVIAAGLRSPLIVRKAGVTGSGDRYNLIGPCNIPVVQDVRLWKETSAEQARRCELV